MQAHFSKTVLFSAVASLMVATASASDITLSSNDGIFSLSGELIEFDGSSYLLKSALGQVRIEATAVVCSGDDCPDLSAFNRNFMVAGVHPLGKKLLPMLLEDFVTGAGLQTAAEGAGSVALHDTAGEVSAVVTLGSGEASDGFAALADGTAALTVSMRQASGQEVSMIDDAGFGNISSVEQHFVLAMDGLVILVSPDNPVNSLTIEQVGNVFSGKITNWSEVGGPDAAISVYLQSESTSDSEFFRSEVLAQTGGDLTRSASVVYNNGGISEKVVGDVFGIGFSSFANKGAAKMVSLEGGCGVLSIPTELSIKTEEYPLSRRLSVYYPDRVLPDIANDLIAYLGTDAAQIPVAQAGYVSLNVEQKAVNDLGLRFANAILSDNDEISRADLAKMAKLLVGANRISTTFRFIEGTSTLDSRAKRDVERLIGWLSGQNLTNKEIYLVGFTDNNGKSNVNMALAEQRAQQVLDEMTANAPTELLDGLNIKIVGLGEVSPMACSAAPSGRFVNRRVEVWISGEN
ncbi:hypothetical protein A9Q96_15420 [Rhodobacterales bacterium 52_120_T64]|nr:hypothetical protein A9Q96_15420 [Rhodobacterales bacterium 52_120_T64]